ncbi:histidine kinase [Aquabacter sp. CN5-332]|uniref:sensor histidine kinase n=1 Tax=Aquabacter sp. CN5-332 TaxID=3156608 RepID=UPI0032B4A8C5
MVTARLGTSSRFSGGSAAKIMHVPEHMASIAALPSDAVQRCPSDIALDGIDGVFFIMSAHPGSDLKVETYNQAFQDFVRADPDPRSVDRTCAPLQADVLKKLAAKIRKCAERGRAIRFDLPVGGRDGRRWEFVLTPVCQSGTFHRQVVGHGRDVTLHRQALSDLAVLTERILHAQEEERRRIARELHDSTLQHLVALGIALSRLEITMGKDQSTADTRRDTKLLIADMRAALASTHAEIRTLSLMLHPPLPEHNNVGDALRQFAASFSRRTGIAVHLDIAPAVFCRSKDIAAAIMRIAQEALMNVYRHSGAENVVVSFASGGDTAILTIEDDGRGLCPGAAPGVGGDIGTLGVGIPGMRARVAQLRGELLIRNGRRGVVVRAAIPQAIARRAAGARRRQRVP